MPCNFHLRGLAEHVKEGVRAAGGTPMEFNTVAISDGITMGTEGMKTSLVSREVIADSIELMCRGYQFDAVVALWRPATRRSPGAVMALARLDIPCVMLYGGSIAPGRWHDHDVTIVDVFEAIGAHAAGEHVRRGAARARGCRQPRRRRLRRPVHRQHDGLRVRGAGDLARRLGDGPRRGLDDKDTVAERIGELVMRVLAEDLRPSQVITRDSLENAIACVCASGGSTNGVLHLLAVAREAGVELEIDDFERISRQHPAAGRPEARRALRRHRPLCAPAACR